MSDELTTPYERLKAAADNGTSRLVKVNRADLAGLLVEVKELREWKERTLHLDKPPPDIGGP